jgi:hypothetical protein
MTIPRLAILIGVGIVATDYKLNDGRLINVLRDTMVQWCYWLDDNVASLAQKLVHG